ncbi:hypothetical protein [Corallococcus sp. AB038B]|uniref:hypothetical protein n=1 Tax=Corallococcus sp. AB038B TaxID=2316718 RepID=UPI000ECAEE81|nr:hypothetical protein [Corallococcus sp. AB038B]RKH92985.1 hypothetical protein D7Y04_41935 [Corallococcus sp. AB038B]
MLSASLQCIEHHPVTRWLYVVDDDSEVLEVGDLGADASATNEDLVHYLRPRWPNLNVTACTILRGPSIPPEVMP